MYNKKRRISKIPGKAREAQRAEEPVYDLYNNFVRERRLEKPITRLLYAAYCLEGRENEMINATTKWVNDFNDIKMSDINENMNGDGMFQDSADFNDNNGFYTGFMLSKKGFMLNLIEADPEDVEKYIVQLKEEAEREDSIYERVTVLAYNEENIDRILPAWGCYSISTSSEVFTENEKSNDEATEVAWKAYRQFLETAEEMR